MTIALLGIGVREVLGMIDSKTIIDRTTDIDRTVVEVVPNDLY